MDRASLLGALAALLTRPAPPSEAEAGAWADAIEIHGGETARDAATRVRTARAIGEARIAAAAAMRVLAQAETESEPSRPVARTRTERKRKRERATASPSGPLDQPVESVGGIGRVAGDALRRRGVSTLLDLALLLPRRYEDERRATPFGEMVVGERTVVVGRVATTNVRGRRAEVTLEPLESDPGGRYALLRLVWFRAHGGFAARFLRGARVRAAGVVEEYRGAAQMTHPDVTVLGEESEAKLGVVPRYSELAGVAPRTLARAIGVAAERIADSLPEAVPADVLAAEGLPRLGAAIRALHAPPHDLDDATLVAWNEGRTPFHARLAFEELFQLELVLAARRKEDALLGAEGLVATAAPLARLRAALPFTLTAAQERVAREISADLTRTRPMRRLLQGDVGSGKTAVAMLAAAHVVAAGAQVALMAPTEVLAEQHFRSLAPLGEALHLRMALVVGGARASHRRDVQKRLADGTLDLAVGTHALLSEGLSFRRLRLAIVDEQHRFGVAQRLRLVQAAATGVGPVVSPHLLVMTATPIPRTLALALYGDLDVSVLDELPPGRKAPVTRAYPRERRMEAYAQVDRALAAGGQAFVVCPRIEESEEDDDDVLDATATHAELSARYADRGVGLLHARLPSDERQLVMERFLHGDVQVLVATTVIEVGVDVPRANVIVIEHAERFGLAQLHQLRGRVGRGGQASACLLVHEARGEDAIARLRVLCETSDGFRIAEEDMEIRGPGELFGRRQSGLPGFRFGDLRRDGPLLERARLAARAMLARDPDLASREHEGARRALARLQASPIGVVREEAG